MLLKDVAEYLGGKIVGDAHVEIRGIRGINEAEEGDLTFIANPKYRKSLETTRASAIIVSPKTLNTGKNILVVEDPYLAMAKVLGLFYPEKDESAGISDEARIAGDADVSGEACLYPGVYVGRNARVDKNVILYPGVFIGDDVVVEEGSVLHPHVTVYRRCRIGKRVIIHAGVVVGSDGFGFANPGVDNFKVPQVGYVQIDDDCEIGANTTIDRGALGKTWIQRGVKIDNLVQIGHNVILGEKSVIVAQVGVSGSTRLGKSVILGGQTGVAGHITIGDHVMVAAKSGVHKSVPSGCIISGSPQLPHRDWLRTQAVIPQLPDMKKTILTLQKKIECLEEKIENLKKG